MNNWPRIITLRSLVKRLASHTKTEAFTAHGWWLARGYGYPSFWSRFRPAWLVFIGKADALIWPEDEHE